MGQIEAALFDCDGLLVATEALFTVAEAEIFASRGRTFGPEHKQQVLGHPVREVGRRLAEMLGEPGVGDRLAAELLARVEELVAEPLEPLPGVLDVLEACRGRVATVVVSNSPRVLVETTLRSAGLDGRFDAVVTLEDAEHPKPAPDLYLHGARRAGATPGACIAFEDSPTGVRAARAANIRVIGVPAHAGHDIGATWQLPSLASPSARQLLADLLGLELAASAAELTA